MKKYNHKKIEAKWQKYWQVKKTFFAKDFSKKPKKYILTEFPYPSGEGLHMGHLRPYVAGDVYARFNRLAGKEVIFPMGWDAFGLPAENYAIKTGVNPAVSTKKNIKNVKRQMQSWGLSFDWSREVDTTDPEYYKWTQWLFLQFYKVGLAYEATGLINWCPKDKTGLANEEVIDGKCERCGTVVEKKELRQWYFKITEYAEKLLEGLKTLNQWPEAVKVQQQNWIGKKTGINISYDVESEYNYVLLHGYDGSPESIYFPWLKKQLEQRGLKVFAPALPNSENPTEQEQVDLVLKNCKFDENTILLGHSLGSVVALKVLEKLQTKIAGLVLTGGFTDPNFKDHKRPFENSFGWKFNFEKIKQNTGFVRILHDSTDTSISIEQANILASALGITLKIVKAQSPHFGSKEEPEALQAIAPKITCFTTRPDTNFGATFLVIGPEHPLLKNRDSLNIDLKIWKEIESYKVKAASEGDQERTAENKNKTGVFTGLYCVNTLNNYKMPLYVADYVLGNVGTGAVIGVPGHDQRDFEFAKVFNIEVSRVVQKDPSDNSPITSIEQVQEEEGVMVNSGFLNGMNIHDATKKIMDYIEEKGYGRRVVNYKLRDWVFSRQRYWGEPIPIIHCPSCGIVPVPEKDLPVKLPPVRKYEPTGTGESPLAAIKSFVNVKCPVCKIPAKRETNTMPQWAGSSWYWLRYTDPKNKKAFADLKKQKYWTPVDVYFGGMEHTTLHLLYSRFWNLFLYDQGLVTVKEPYTMRKPHGIVLAADGDKMSKSKGNVVNPDVIVASDGADTLRMYELFLGPHETAVSWNDQGVVGVKRFLDRVWNLVLQKAENKKSEADSEKVLRALNKLIKKVSQDLEEFHFNTCISSFMEFSNQIKDEQISKASIKSFLILLYPFAPHITEELNEEISRSAGQKSVKSLQLESWPEWDEKLTIDNTVEVVVQINGKVKAKLSLTTGMVQDKAVAAAMEIDTIKQSLAGQSIKRTIYVPNRLINFVI
jgi:leucyl-tRNA synthetase